MNYVYSLLPELTFAHGVTNTPGKGAVVVTGLLAGIRADWVGSPGAGAVRIAGFAPVVVEHVNSAVTAGLGRLVVASHVPTVVGVPLAIPPTPAGGDSPGKPLHWQKRDERLRPVFGNVLRRKNFDMEAPPAFATFDPEDSRENERAEQAAILAALDGLAEELTREKAARGLARVARDAGRRMAVAKVQAATEQARDHAARAMKIAQRLAAGRFIPDEDE